MKIKVELAQRAVYSRVWLDDVEITSSVRGIAFKASVDSFISEVTLTLMPKSVELEGEAGRVIGEIWPEKVTD